MCENDARLLTIEGSGRQLPEGLNCEGGGSRRSFLKPVTHKDATWWPPWFDLRLLGRRFNPIESKKMPNLRPLHWRQIYRYHTARATRVIFFYAAASARPGWDFWMLRVSRSFPAAAILTIQRRSAERGKRLRNKGSRRLHSPVATAGMGLSKWWPNEGWGWGSQKFLSNSKWQILENWSLSSNFKSADLNRADRLENDQLSETCKGSFVFLPCRERSVNIDA